MATFDSSCLLTTFKNSSAGPLFFGFLPPHGRTLAANEEVSEFGQPAEIVCQGDRLGKKRQLDSFLGCIADGSLQVTSLPSLILKDTLSPHNPKMVTLSSGVLGIHDPCYDTSIGP